MSRKVSTPAAKNNRESKRLVDHYDGHNRKAGSSAADKAATSRRRRRSGRRFNREMVEQREHDDFSKRDNKRKRSK